MISDVVTRLKAQVSLAKEHQQDSPDVAAYWDVQADIYNDVLKRIGQEDAPAVICHDLLIRWTAALNGVSKSTEGAARAFALATVLDMFEEEDEL